MNLVFTSAYPYILYLGEPRSRTAISLKRPGDKDTFMPFSPPQARDSQTTGLHTRARLLGTRLKTDNFRWSKMAKGKDPKPI